MLLWCLLFFGEPAKVSRIASEICLSRAKNYHYLQSVIVVFNHHMVALHFFLQPSKYRLHSMLHLQAPSKVLERGRHKSSDGRKATQPNMFVIFTGMHCALLNVVVADGSNKTVVIRLCPRMAFCNIFTVSPCVGPCVFYKFYCKSPGWIHNANVSLTHRKQRPRPARCGFVTWSTTLSMKIRLSHAIASRVTKWLFCNVYTKSLPGNRFVVSSWRQMTRQIARPYAVNHSFEFPGRVS